jgi:putative FmdB family regulatory protein
MPIFEYICKDCGKKFEAIVYGSNQAECPSCHGKKLEQQLSVFAVSASGSSKSTPAMDSAPSPCGSCGHPGGPGSCAFEN